MHDDGPTPTPAPPRTEESELPRRPLTPAAERALAEAAERRRLREEAEARASDPKEVGGRKGPDPVRYGDWEKDGIVSDF